MPIGELCERDTLEEMVSDYQRMCAGDCCKEEGLLEKWPEGLHAEHLRQNIAKINKSLKKHLRDPALLPFYWIPSDRRYGDTRYGVRLEKENIVVE